MAEIFAWHYGPKGEAQIFYDDADIPADWRDHPFATADALDHDGNGEPGGSLPNNVPKLKKIAKDEGIDLGEARKGDEIKAAIVAARLAKAD